MADQEKRPIITTAELQRMNELTEQIAEFRKTLAPMTESVVKTIEEAPIWDAIKALMDFEGKDSVKFMVKNDSKPFEVVFKSKRC
jgi:hypothetical protein